MRCIGRIEGGFIALRAYRIAVRVEYELRKTPLGFFSDKLALLYDVRVIRPNDVGSAVEQFVIIRALRSGDASDVFRDVCVNRKDKNIARVFRSDLPYAVFQRFPRCRRHVVHIFGIFFFIQQFRYCAKDDRPSVFFNNFISDRFSARFFQSRKKDFTLFALVYLLRFFRPLARMLYARESLIVRMIVYERKDVEARADRSFRIFVVHIETRIGCIGDAVIDGSFDIRKRKIARAGERCDIFPDE